MKCFINEITQIAIRPMERNNGRENDDAIASEDKGWLLMMLQWQSAKKSWRWDSKATTDCVWKYQQFESQVIQVSLRDILTHFMDEHNGTWNSRNYFFGWMAIDKFNIKLVDDTRKLQNVDSCCGDNGCLCVISCQQKILVIRWHRRLHDTLTILIHIELTLIIRRVSDS